MVKKVVIAGYGCLGKRLAEQLLLGDYHLVLLDDYAGWHKGKKVNPVPEGVQEVTGTFEHVQADLTEWGEWTSAFAGADTVVHFAAVNPYPEATWEESRLSMRMGANVIAAAQRAGVRRLVLASSSHVMGGYLQNGARRSATAPEIGPKTPVCRFTQYKLPGFDTDATGYAVAKLSLEEIARAAAAATPGLSVVVIRIGWCQPGENHPRQMTATATPTISGDKVKAEQRVEEEVALGFDNRDLILAWLHRLWLSTRDFKQLFKRAIETDIEGYLCVCGMSRNKDMRWSTEGWDILGYNPEDDAERALSDKPSAKL